MRISETDRQTIQRAILEKDPSAQIYLFGSRVDDDAKGGDIDLLVISEKFTLLDKLAVLAKLHQALGDQKIDLVVARDLSKPFTRIARQDAIPL